MKIGNKGPSLWQFYGIVGITGITGITGIATIHTEGAQFRNSHNSSESDNQTIGRGFFLVQNVCNWRYYIQYFSRLLDDVYIDHRYR